MIAVARRKRYLVTKLQIGKKFQTFEISIPRNVKLITGVYINYYVFPALEIKIGTIGFQSQDQSDVFLIYDLHGENMQLSDDSQFRVFQGDFDIDRQYISGNIPKKIPLWVEGDTTVISGWFKANYTVFPYPLHIILEYQEVDKLIEGGQDERAIYP